MKILMAVLVAGGVSFATAYMYVSNQKTSQFNQEREALISQWESERDRLENDLRRAKGQLPRLEQITTTVEVPVEQRISPQEILNRLIHLKPPPEPGRSQALRRIIHELENLADAGAESLPHIRAFLALNQDVEYERERNEEDQNRGGTPGGPGGGPGGGGPGGPGFGGGDGRGGEGRGGPPGGFGSGIRTPPTDFLYPPSLRLGLMSVLKQIGGEPAEQILAEVLASTGRGIEVAYVARILEQMAPEKYREVALTSAKDLLLNPLIVDSPSRLDRDSKGYLYGVLRMYNDTSFAPTAQTLLVGSDGRIDRSALGYLTAVLQEQALPSLYQAFNDARITNQWERVALAAPAFNYVGNNPTANQMFTDIVASEDSGMMRYMAIASLAGGEFGPVRREVPKDPQTILSRQRLVQSILPLIQGDERLTGMANRTAQNLQNLLDGKPVESRGGRDGRGGPPRGR